MRECLPLAIVIVSAAPCLAEVDFAGQVEPLLRNKCLECHRPGKIKGGLRLNSRAAALKGGDSGPSIVPGDSGDSPLIHVVEDGEMPPKGPPLTEAEIALLREWIDAGANWPEKAPAPPASTPSTPVDDGTPATDIPAVAEDALPAAITEEGVDEGTPDFALSITPAVQWWTVDGNEQQFRQHAWTRDGWSGGIGRLTLEDWVDPDTKFTAEGSALAPDDLDLTFTLDRSGTGFVRGGIEHHRSYDNDYGGYYGNFPTPAFRSDRDLELDYGRLWAEVGIRRPDWPEITLGYEYRFKDGDQSTQHWGPSRQGAQRNIFPSFKSVDEDVHIFRADLRHDWDGLEIENNFWAEWTDLETRRYEANGRFNSGAVPDVFTTIDESYDSTQLSNNFSLQKQIRDWWLLTGGYYYSRLEADANFQKRTFNTSTGNLIGRQWIAQPIDLDWHTHIFNAGTSFGPWEGLTLAAGVQSNWEAQDAEGSATLLPTPNLPPPLLPRFSSLQETDRRSMTTREYLTVRYDKLPCTVLFAEMEFEQDNTDYFEQDSGTVQGFLRDTEVRSNDQDYRAGVTWSPRSDVSLNAHYRYREERDRYDHDRDFGPELSPGRGYSAFITGRDMQTQEVRTRLNWQPKPWMKTLFTFQLESTDYDTKTDSVPPAGTPGGWLRAGEFEARIYSVDLVLTPWQRLAMNGTFSYHDTSTETADSGDPAVDEYEGDIYSVILGGTYMLDKKTDLFANYSYSKGDFSQGNDASGLPLGIEYDLHALQAGLSTEISDGVRMSLQYLLQHYEEPTFGGLNDYTAHGLFANWTWSW